MGELKGGWQRVKFAQLAECVNDRVDDPIKSGVDRYVGLNHLDSESLTIRRWGTPDEVESTKLRFRPGDIIFGKRRAYQRKLAVADFEGICSAHAMVLRAKPGAVVPEFLPFFMQSDTFMERAVAISVGSLSPTINWKTLAAEEFALPPIEEQRRMFTALQSADEQQAALTELERATHLLVLSSLAEHFGRELADHGPVRWLADKEQEMAAGSRAVAPLGRVVEAVIDYRGKTPPYDDAGSVPVVSQEDVQEGGLEPTTKWVTEETASQWMHRGLPMGGDVVFRMERFPGEVARLPDRRQILTRGVFALRADQAVLSAEYLYWYLFWLKRGGYWMIHAHATTVPRLYKNEVLRTPVLLLEPTRQQRLVAALTELERCIGDTRHRAQALQRLRRNLLRERLDGYL